MQITEVQIIPVKPHDGLIAFASIVVDECFFLSSIGIHKKLTGGLRLTYPTKDVGHRPLNIFHPINQQTSKLIEEVIFNQCKKVMNSDDRYSSS